MHNSKKVMMLCDHIIRKQALKKVLPIGKIVIEVTEEDRMKYKGLDKNFWPVYKRHVIES